MRISLFTNNLLYHKAFTDLQNLLLKYKPDIICLQEFEQDEESLRKLASIGYLLAGSSKTFVRNHKVFYVATFYRKSAVASVSSGAIDLPRTHYETFLYYLRGAHTPRKILKTVFKFGHGAELLVYNLHLTALATNGGRMRQLLAALEDLRISGMDRFILAGDFNYPYRRKKLEFLMKQYSLEEATKEIDHTFESKLFKIIPLKLKDDYILYKGVDVIDTKKINWRVSDHYPIISYFEI